MTGQIQFVRALTLLVVTNAPCYIMIVFFLQWMPFEEYAAQPFVKKHELLKYLVDICLAKKEGKYTGFTPVPTTSTFSQEKNFLYLNGRDLSSP